MSSNTKNVRMSIEAYNFLTACKEDETYDEAILWLIDKYQESIDKYNKGTERFIGDEHVTTSTEMLKQEGIQINYLDDDETLGKRLDVKSFTNEKYITDPTKHYEQLTSQLSRRESSVWYSILNLIDADSNLIIIGGDTLKEIMKQTHIKKPERIYSIVDELVSKRFALGQYKHDSDTLALMEPTGILEHEYWINPVLVSKGNLLNIWGVYSKIENQRREQSGKQQMIKEVVHPSEIFSSCKDSYGFSPLVELRISEVEQAKALGNPISFKEDGRVTEVYNPVTDKYENIEDDPFYYS